MTDDLKGNTTVVKSGNIWGILFALVAPIISAKLKLTPDEILNTTNILIAGAGSLFAIFRRITAKKKIVSVM